jgi:hypothetical protein
MKKPRKLIRPELRVRITPSIFKALKLAVARDAGVRDGLTTAEVVEAALASYPMVKREFENV